MNNENVMNQIEDKKESEQKPAEVSKAGTVRGLLETSEVKNRLEEILKDRAPQYVSSIITLVNNDDLLKKADPYSVVTSAMIAATLNLPIEKNLGYAYIIPYKGVASFQLGYKGLIQLSLRTGQYKHINVITVYEGELIEFDKLTEKLVISQDEKQSNHVIGYAGFFELINGFTKTTYWTAEEMEGHKKKFSKSSKVWADNYDAMAKKTVIRNMLSKFGILSIELQEGMTKEVTDPRDYEERREINPEIIENE